MLYKIHHKEIKTDCVSHSFETIEECIERAKELGKIDDLKKYENLKNQGEKIIPLCKGPRAPDYEDPIEILTCKNCEMYRDINKL